MRHEDEAYFQEGVRVFANVCNPYVTGRRSKENFLFIGNFPLTQLNDVISQFKEMQVCMFTDMHKFKRYYWDTEAGREVIVEFERVDSK